MKQRRDLDYLFAVLGDHKAMRRITKRINQTCKQQDQLLMFLSRILQNQWLILKALELTCGGSNELKQALFEAAQWHERQGFYDADLSKYIEQGLMNKELDEGIKAE